MLNCEKYDNPEMTANHRANLCLGARGRGDLDGALMRLEATRESAPAAHLQTEIDLWLTELCIERGERAAADEALARAEARLAVEECGRPREWAERPRAKIIMERI